MDQWFKLVAEVGFPIAAACAGGYFVFLTMKFILAGVMSSVKGVVGNHYSVGQSSKDNEP